MTGPVVTAAKAAGGGGGPRLVRAALVVAVNGDGTVDLELGGSESVVASAAVLAQAGLVAGDSVWCLQWGSDVLVLGRQGAAERTYVPALAATTTTPTLGTDAVQVGRWMLVGNRAFVRGSIRFGTAGINAGSGNYLVGLPLPVQSGLGSAFAPIGWVILRDESDNKIAECFATVNADGAANFAIRYPATVPLGTSTLVSATGPVTWAAGDRIDFQVVYPIS